MQNKNFAVFDAKAAQCVVNRRCILLIESGLFDV